MKYKYFLLGIIIGFIISKFYIFFKINTIKLFEIILNYFKL